MWNELRIQQFSIKKSTNLYYPLAIFIISWTWVLLSFKVIIPAFRTDNHFAEGYYNGVLANAFGYIFHSVTYRYLFVLLGPLIFLTVLAPQFLIIVAPEFGINLLSSNWNLRNIVFHYTAVIQPWIFIGTIYGAQKVLNFTSRIFKVRTISYSVLGWSIITFSLAFSYFKGPLPYSREADIHPFVNSRQEEAQFVKRWADRVSDDNLKVSTSGQIAPFFTSRRYFYNFSDDYRYADYVIISVSDVEKGYENEIARPAYKRLKIDQSFEKIEAENGYEVYKKVASM
jgi:uncharacterized membrane protein